MGDMFDEGFDEIGSDVKSTVSIKKELNYMQKKIEDTIQEVLNHLESRSREQANQ